MVWGQDNQAKKRFCRITDERGKVLYEGEDKRQSVFNSSKRFFEFTFVDMVKLAGILFCAYAFIFQTKQDIKDLKKDNIDIKELIQSQRQINEHISQYMENHDSYLSAVNGQRFRGGIPVNSIAMKDERTFKAV